MTMTMIFTLSLSAQQNGLPGFLNKTKGALDPAAIAGLYSYDSEALLDHIKVRKASKRTLVSGIVRGYNTGLDGLKTDNMTSLVGLGLDLKEIIANKEYLEIFTARSDFKNNISVISEQRNALHNNMEQELFEVLTRRQKRKWHKYQSQRETDLATQFDVGDVLTFVGM